MSNLVLTAVVAAVFLLFYRISAIRKRWLKIENALEAFSKRTLLSAVSVSLLAFVVNWLIALHAGIPQPRVHDEFSYLLAADTFARGRLTNPTHPLWRFFETFHVLQRPTYASKYPPAQGLLLTLGKFTTGEPIVGAWLGGAILCGVFVWMLRAVVPGKWAIVSAIILAMHPQLIEWCQTYWGGSSAGIGGALILGAFLRQLTRHHVIDPLIVGLGAGILANSRPYEGLIFSIPVYAFILFRSRRNFAISLLALLPILSFTCFYNFRVTGSPIHFPYITYERQYAVAPPLLFQQLRPEPKFNQVEMREYAEQIEIPHFETQHTLGGFAKIAGNKLRFLLSAFASPWLLVVPIIMLPRVIQQDSKTRIAAVSLLAVLAATLLSNWTRPQYVAPACGALLLLFGVSTKEFTARWNGLGRGVLVGIFAGEIAMIFASAHSSTDQFQRQELLAALTQEDQQHLVLIRYLPGHRPDDEWVYNEADIDAAKIVWAHDRGEKENQQLLAYFPHRKVWRVDVDSMQASVNRFQRTMPTTENVPTNR